MCAIHRELSLAYIIRPRRRSLVPFSPSSNSWYNRFIYSWCSCRRRAIHKLLCFPFSILHIRLNEGGGTLLAAHRIRDFVYYWIDRSSTEGRKEGKRRSESLGLRMGDKVVRILVGRSAQVAPLARWVAAQRRMKLARQRIRWKERSLLTLCVLQPTLWAF